MCDWSASECKDYKVGIATVACAASESTKNTKGYVGIDMTIGWIGFLGQPGRIQSHGVERGVHDVALLVERQEIYICDAGAPINLAIPLMLDECLRLSAIPAIPVYLISNSSEFCSPDLGYFICHV